MSQQQIKQKQAGSPEKGPKPTSAKKRSSPRKTIPVKDRLRMIVVSEPVGASHIDDNSSTRPWFSNPMFLLGMLAIAMALVELYVLAQLL